MNCPYCGKEMSKGAIPTGVRWYRDDELTDGLQLASYNLFGYSEIPADYCGNCRKIVIDVPEKVETTADRLKDKWQSFRSRTEEKRNNAARKQEEQQEKQKEKRRKKDPWEV